MLPINVRGFPCSVFTHGPNRPYRVCSVDERLHTTITTNTSFSERVRATHLEGIYHNMFAHNVYSCAVTYVLVKLCMH